MSDERLSITELRIRSDEERPRLGGAVLPFTHQRAEPSAEEVAQAERARRARTLPDSLFADDPELKRLRAIYDTRAKIASSVLTQPLKRATEAFAEHIKTAEEDVPWAVMEDVSDGNHDFPKARQAIAALQLDRDVFKEVQRAAVLFGSGAANAQAVRDAVEQARRALDERLMALKRAHVDAANA